MLPSPLPAIFTGCLLGLSGLCVEGSVLITGPNNHPRTTPFFHSGEVEGRGRLVNNYLNYINDNIYSPGQEGSNQFNPDSKEADDTWDLINNNLHNGGGGGDGMLHRSDFFTGFLPYRLGLLPDLSPYNMNREQQNMSPLVWQKRANYVHHHPLWQLGPIRRRSVRESSFLAEGSPPVGNDKDGGDDTVAEDTGAENGADEETQQADNATPTGKEREEPQPASRSDWEGRSFLSKLAAVAGLGYWDGLKRGGGAGGQERPLSKMRGLPVFHQNNDLLFFTRTQRNKD